MIPSINIYNCLRSKYCFAARISGRLNNNVYDYKNKFFCIIITFSSDCEKYGITLPKPMPVFEFFQLNYPKFVYSI